MSKKKILVLCPYPQNVAPSQRLKFEQYYESFREAGYEVHVRPFISTAFWKIIYKRGYLLQKIAYTIVGYVKRVIALFTIGSYDVVYVHLWVTPFGPPVFERLVTFLSKGIVYDIDDLVYLKNVESKAHKWVTLVKGRQKPIYLMKNADHVITCTPHLDAFVRRYNPNTTDISSTVDTELRYRATINYDKDVVTLGWSGSLSTSKYFYLLAGVLKELAKQYHFRILVIGDASVHIEGLPLEAVDWNEASEMAYLQQIDIGLYPLPDEEWVLGKSGLKAIQYMALGIPTVATAIGANYRVIEDGTTGFLVKSEAEWIETLGRLIEDKALREAIGLKARKKVEKEFSITANKAKYLQVLQQVSSGL